MSEEVKTLPPRFKLVALEQTEFWKQDIIKITGRAMGVYLYDETLTVNCCEITPSYELHFLYNQFENYVGEDDKEAMEALRKVADCDYSELERESGGENVEYHQTRSIDSQPAHRVSEVNQKWVDGIVAGYDQPLSMDDYNKIVEEVREYYICNPEELRFDAPALKFG